MPEGRSLGFGAALGRAAYRIAPERRRQAADNLHLAFTDWSDARIDATVRASFVEMGRALVEWARLPESTPDALRARIEFCGLEHFEAAMARGRGVLTVTAHFGSWELFPAAVHVRYPEIDFVSVGRRFDDPWLQQRITRRRVLGGGQLIPQDAREILRALRRGAAVGVLVDQYRSQRRGGVLVPFFGRRAWTQAGPATLALRTGAAIVPASIRRIDGLRHRVVVRPEIPVTRSSDRGRDILEATARIAYAIEDMIRSHPESWIWTQRRWRNSPDVPS